MPTILLINGFRFYFYAGDRNEPAHIHVEKGDGVGKIWLEPELKPQYFDHFKSQEKKEAMKLATENYKLLKSKRDEFFRKSI